MDEGSSSGDLVQPCRPTRRGTHTERYGAAGPEVDRTCSSGDTAPGAAQQMRAESPSTDAKSANLTGSLRVQSVVDSSDESKYATAMPPWRRTTWT